MTLCLNDAYFLWNNAYRFCCSVTSASSEYCWLQVFLTATFFWPNSMELIPSWEASSQPAGQWIPVLPRHYHIHKGPSLSSIHSRMGPSTQKASEHCRIFHVALLGFVLRPWASIVLINRWYARPKGTRKNSQLKYIRFEVFAAMTMNNAVFWDVALCRSCVNRRYGVIQTMYTAPHLRKRHFSQLKYLNFWFLYLFVQS
jgi:hypothetical protein